MLALELLDKFLSCLRPAGCVRQGWTSSRRRLYTRVGRVMNPLALLVLPPQLLGKGGVQLCALVGWFRP